MNEQQRAELERIRDVLYPATGLEDYDEEIIGRVLKDINALLAQDAPPKQDVPETNFGNMAEPKIGCVNHDCDQCKAAQPDYAWPTIEDYEKEVGFKVNDAFKAAWTMARTTNDLFKQMGENA